MTNTINNEMTRWEHKYDSECEVSYETCFVGEKKIGYIESFEIDGDDWGYSIYINDEYITSIYSLGLSEVQMEFMNLLKFFQNNTITF